jgi:hypothetical protein
MRSKPVSLRPLRSVTREVVGLPHLIVHSAELPLSLWHFDCGCRVATREKVEIPSSQMRYYRRARNELEVWRCGFRA